MHFSDKIVPVEELADFYRLDSEKRAWLMFVSTADGRGTFKEPGAYGGDLIALQHLKDSRKEAVGAYCDWRLLQFGWAQADCIIGSASIIRTEEGQLWNPVDSDILDYRRNVLKRERKYPLKVVLTAKADITLNEAMFRYKDHNTIIFTTESGREKLEPKKTNSNVLEIYAAGEKEVDPKRVFEILRKDYSANFIDITGGPTLAGKFLQNRLIDELRLTISPQLVGDRTSSGQERPSILSGISFGKDNSPLLDLRDTGYFGSHIYTRYDLNYRH